MIYIPANNNMCSSMAGAPVTYAPGKSYAGVKYGRGSIAPDAKHFGEVQAWNVDTGRQVWMHPFPKSPNWGSMLTTAGGLVFTGGTADKKIRAFDAATGKVLWEHETNSGIVAPPTTFVVDGRQYLAVHTGWGGDPRGMQASLNNLFPGEFPPVPEGGAVWVFAVQ
jgi:alcohol dehydrogenase (cytochrome c)